MSPRSLLSTRRLAAGVLLASALSACSGIPLLPGQEDNASRAGSREPGAEQPGADQPRAGQPGGPLTRQQAEQALLTVEHLSPKFELDDSEDDPDDEGPDWGCLLPGGITDEKDKQEGKEEGDADVAFKAKREPGMPGVLSSVFSGTGGEARATKAMGKLADSYATCKRVSTTDEDGTVWRFDVTSDTELWAPGGEQQINVAASGSIKLDSLTVPIEVRLTIVRVDAAGSMVGFFDTTEAAPAATRAQRDLAAAASARLAAVLAGEEPPAPRPLLTDYEFSDLFEELLSPEDEGGPQAV